ncbi:Zinc finger, CCHC-type [Sesbania bispinosa]|nr:Zinc finger, CCHC-type [Sesbania bispinosa]
MRGGKAACSARVPVGLSGEEEDQLRRSTKKAKWGSSQETVVKTLKRLKSRKPLTVNVRFSTQLSVKLYRGNKSLIRKPVQVDLREVLVSTFKLNKRIYRVEYEGLHLVCFHCGRYGHRKDVCPLLAQKEDRTVNEGSSDPKGNHVSDAPVPKNPVSNDSEENFGPWMIAHKRPRRKMLYQKQPKEYGDGEISGKDHIVVRKSRFSVLDNIPWEKNQEEDPLIVNYKVNKHVPIRKDFNNRQYSA